MGPEPTILVGSSFGAAVTLMQAASDPASVRALILSGSMLPEAAGDRSTIRRRVMRRRLSQRLGDVRRVVEAVRDGRLQPNPRSVRAFLLRGNAADPEAISDRIVDANSGPSATSALARLRATVGAGSSSLALLTDPVRFAALLDAVTCPVLVIHGSRDRTVPVANAKAAVAGRTGWQLVVLDDVGHLPHLEVPNRWLAVVTDWLQRLG